MGNLEETYITVISHFIDRLIVSCLTSNGKIFPSLLKVRTSSTIWKLLYRNEGGMGHNFLLENLTPEH